MRLYFNEDLVHNKPEEGDVLAAFETLRGSRRARLELRRGPDCSMSVRREDGLGFAVALQRPDGIFGLSVHELFAEQVAGALREYFSDEPLALMDEAEASA